MNSSDTSAPSTPAAQVLPEPLETLLNKPGNLSRQSIREAVASILSTTQISVGRCQDCRFLDTRSFRDNCTLHGRITEPTNHCSWFERKD